MRLASSRSGLIGLAVALVAATVLLVLPSAGSEPAEQAVFTVEQAWPDAQRVEIPASLPDGPAFNPVYLLDGGAAVGTAPSPSGDALRLLVHTAAGEVRELRRLPTDIAPQYSGVTVAGDRIAWAETTNDPDGLGRTTLWLAGLAADQPARQLTADAGDVVFFNSEYDLLLHSERLHWVAVAPGEETATELRSVPLAGGTVEIRTEPGAWARSAWPWLVSAGTGESGPIQLRDLEARKIIEVDAAGTELVSCSPAWCRVLVLGSDGPGRIDLMRPDGADRREVAAGTATASIIDVAVLDRFEVLSLSDAQRTATGTQQLLLYDLREERTVTVAEGIGSVLYRSGRLWWSTGGSEITGWSGLDLRSLD
ncbi:hypothetical protein O7627_30320 [Solwaraspora sp. WMMD1047]|uniref:hypothetical protein n=1 Tax=Solwaraspora sp. WMMD1047 TaxID=3016102 RepID=UPI0024179B16|nr:hypothetical protein [Solwaraspora sp. WMMD1047]MDG4833571.1 hypothetical protein [Solwaraspora sp. WMMD1047]